MYHWDGIEQLRHGYSYDDMAGMMFRNWDKRGGWDRDFNGVDCCDGGCCTELEEYNDFEIRWCSDDVEKGYGVFAGRNFRANEIIGCYLGKFCREVICGNFKDFEYMFASFHKNYVVDARYAGNLTRFLNHADKHNCDSHTVLHFNGNYCEIHREFFTSCDVNCGDEFTINYGSGYISALLRTGKKVI